MAQVGGEYQQQLTACTQTGSISFGRGDTAVLPLISGGDLLADTKYVIIARAMLAADDGNRVHHWRIRTDDDTLIEAKSLLKIEPVNSTVTNKGIELKFVHSFTTDPTTPADVVMEMRPDRTADLVSIDQSSLKVIDLTGRDFVEVIHTDDSSEYPLTQAVEWSIPGSSLGTDEWLVVGYQRTDMGVTSSNHRIEIFAADDASTSTICSRDENEAEDGNELRSFGFEVRHKASSGTPDFEVQTWQETTGHVNLDRGGYAIAFKTSDWESISFAFNLGTTTVNSTEKTVQFIDGFSPTTTGDFLFFGSCNLADMTNAAFHKIHIEDDGTPTRTGDADMEHQAKYDASARAKIGLFYQVNILSTDTSDYDLQVTTNDATNDTVEHRWLIIWSMELAAGGTAHTATPTEVVGVTDSTPVKQGKERAEPVGVGDVISRVHDAKRTPTETVGVTDATPVKQGKEVSEAVGLTDTVAAALIIKVEITEAIGVTDSLDLAQGKEVAEAVGITDVTARQHDAKRTVTEPVGVTDTTVDDLTTPGLTEVLTEAVGVIDSLDLTQGKEIAEPIGVTDSILPAKTIRVEITEAIGVTDAVAATRSIVRVEDQYLTLPGTVGHYASTGTHPSLNLIDNFFAGIYAAPVDWTNLQAMLAKWTATGDNRSWILRATASGAIHVRASDDGATNEGVTGPALGFADGSGHWIGFDFVAGFVRFYDGGTDPDNPVWVEIGSGSQFPTITSVNASSADVEIGTTNDGTTDPLNGKVNRAVIYNDIARTGLVADFDAGDFNAGDTDTDTAVGSAGKTWTLNGATPKIGPIVGVTDETTTIVAAVRVVAELVGVADVIAPARVIVREITENVGVTDSTLDDKTGAASFVIEITEAIGVTDEVVTSEGPWWEPDPVGISPAPVGIDHRTPEKRSPGN